MNGLLDGLKALGPGRLAAMGAVAAAMLGLLALLMLRAPADHMALLYADLDPREAGQVVDVLDRQHVPHQLAAGGAQILVPGDEVARLRLLLLPPLLLLLIRQLLPMLLFRKLLTRLPLART